MTRLRLRPVHTIRKKPTIGSNDKIKTTCKLALNMIRQKRKTDAYEIET